ncbi:glycosyltransferase family 4 protein [Halolamina salifodinae]|uniref:Glycosyltransferase involved in cell wall biosynthesis n=1 Tax=Halolamina salifodinae TaxID=1202767 RepID=A0A8T4H118_9EURY|nr:glycosyltransferase family 4 protein [Halolamina salifodinae]MBP1987018.1 glycosyltransferase involved in cell wall biosynthesis [Halolamina salifodinae]
MHIAFVSMGTAHHGDRRGLERARRTARLLAERGHDVTYLCAQWWGGDAVPTFEHEGIEYRRVTREPAAGAFSVKLPAALWRTGADVIHAVDSIPRHVAVAEKAGTVLRTPVLVDWFGDGAGEPGSEARAAAGADLVTTPSELIRTRVRECGADEGSVRVIPESIDVEMIREAPVDDRFDVVYTRRLDEHANVGTLLLALAERRQRDWSAAIVGDGPEREAVETAAQDLRIDDRITFTGALSEPERVSIYKGAHVFAQTASVEPFATELLRALACGCLSVVEYQANSSAHELVEGVDRGRRVTSPEEMADAITQARNVPHREYDDSFDAYDHRAVLETYLDCYKEIRGGGLL